MATYSGDEFDLINQVWVKTGDRKLVEKKKTSSRVVSNVFARLVAAGQRLMKVINDNEGLPNKELGKFADQINSLADKWER